MDGFFRLANGPTFWVLRLEFALTDQRVVALVGLSCKWGLASLWVSLLVASCCECEFACLL